MPRCQNGIYQGNSCRATDSANTVAGLVAVLVAVLVAASELLKLLKLLVAGQCLSTWQEDMALSFSIICEVWPRYAVEWGAVVMHAALSLHHRRLIA